MPSLRLVNADLTAQALKNGSFTSMIAFAHLPK